MRDGEDPTYAARCKTLEQALGERTAELERIHRLYDAISKVNRAVLRSGSPESLFDEVSRALVSPGGFRMAWVGRYDPTTNQVLAVARAGDDAGCRDNIHDFTAIAVREGRSYVCNDLAVFPIRRAGEVYGAVSIYAPEVGFFGDPEVALLEEMATEVSFALDNFDRESRRQQAEATHRESEERLRLLNDLGETIRVAADPEQSLAAALRMLGEHLRASRCHYADVDPDGDRVTIRHEYTDGGSSMVGQHRLSQFGPTIASVLLRGEDAVVVRDVTTELSPDDDPDFFIAMGIRAFICCTLVRQGVCRAMMAVHHVTPRDWSPNEVGVVQAFVERCWGTIEQCAAEEKLRENEALLRIAGKAARLGGFTIDLPENRITWSDEVCAIHEVPAGTVPPPSRPMARIRRSSGRSCGARSRPAPPRERPSISRRRSSPPAVVLSGCAPLATPSGTLPA